MQKKLLITVGGTGGHVFPALTLAKQLKKVIPDLQILFVGGGLNKNKYFEKESFPFKEVACGTLNLKKPINSLRNTWRIGQGIWQSRNLIRSFCPDLVIGFGSYHTLPTLLAAKLSGTPIILHEANRIPGKVNRLLAPYVTVTGVHFPDTVDYLRGNIIESPIPLREGYRQGSVSKATAKKHFDLDEGCPTVLVFGGSQGAKAINRLVADAFALMPNRKIQVLQFTGDKPTAQNLIDQYREQGITACVKEFETRMDLAWQAADCVIARSGAGTMAEELEFEVPGILIPYPYAADNHQESNADFMVDNVGGAIKRLEPGLTAQTLAKDLSTLFENDALRLKEMHAAMRTYKNLVRPKELWAVIAEMLG